MAKQSSAIPEFMLDTKGKNTEYRINAMVGMQYNPQDPTNSTYTVLVQDRKTNFVRKEEFPPDILRRRFKMGRVYLAGKQIDIEAEQKSGYVSINTALESAEQVQLKSVLTDVDFIQIMHGSTYHRDLLRDSWCYQFETDEATLIIPSAVLALYFYFRSSSMKEALLYGNLDSLYNPVESDFSNKAEPLIVLRSKAALFDGPFLYRYITNNPAKQSFLDFSRYISNYRHKISADQIKSHFIPIKAKFPLRTTFDIVVRYHELNMSLLELKPKWFVTSIVNDSMSFEFEKITVLKGTKATDDPTKTRKFVYKKRKPRSTTPRVRPAPPSNIYGPNKMTDRDDDLNLGLRGKDIIYGSKSIPADPRSQKSEKSDRIVDQGFGYGNSTGATQRSTVETQDKSTTVRPPNFDIFNMCLEFLENSGVFGDITTSSGFDQVVSSDQKLNSRNSFDGVPKRYITAACSFDDYEILLVEVESDTMDFATWVLVSRNIIAESTVLDLIRLRYSEDKKLEEIQQKYNGVNTVLFLRKKHPPMEENGDISDDSLENWANRLLLIIRESGAN